MTSRTIGSIVSILSLPALLLAGGQAPPADRAAAIKESLAKNSVALRQYSWVETTTISLKGEVKKQEQKNCYYGADGKVQKTAIAGQAPAPAKAPEPSSDRRGGRGGGRLKENIVENKVEDMKDYMEKAAALVHEYVPPDPQKIQAAQAAGNVSTTPPATLAIKNYVKSGDSLTLAFDPAAKAMKTYAVQSYVEKPKDDAVGLTVTFALLEDGTSYPAQVVLDVAAKNLQVKVVNSGYKKK